MPSPTLHTETVRHRKVAKRGRKRKNALKRDGTSKSAKELFKKQK